MEQAGKLLVVVGLFGSGKSTMINSFLESNSTKKFRYIKTLTTRKPRNETEASGASTEYDFVSHSEYTIRKSQSTKWDERTVDGEWYGVDVASAELDVASGTYLISSLLPHLSTLEDQIALFQCEVVTILLNVGHEVANARLSERGGNNKERFTLQATLDIKACEALCSIVFTPEGNIENDTANFNRLICSIVLT